MARTTLSYLITHIRELINDASGTAQVFSDDAIQRHLDAHRVDLYTEPLAAIPTWTGGGSTAYYEYRVGWSWLEATHGGTALFVVQDSLGTVRGTSTWAEADYQLGSVTFTTNQAGTALYLTARSYDPYGAAADLLTDWAQKVSLQFDFSSDQQSFSRSQKQTLLLAAAERYRRAARPRRVNVTRPDVARAVGTDDDD